MRITKLIAVLIVVFVPSILNAQQVQTLVQTATTAQAGGTVTLTLEQVPLRMAIAELSRVAGVRINYRDESLPRTIVSISARQEPWRSVAHRMLKNTNLEILEAEGGQFLLVSAGNGKSRSSGVITGKVTDAKSGKGIGGANITLDNDARGVVGDENGLYRLSGVSVGTHTVTVRLVGYAKQTRSITVGEGATVVVDFKLEPSASVLDQVVVTGTIASTELRAIPNAITVITANQMEERGITRIDQLFRGDIPGLFAQNVGSKALLDEVTMFSRGTTSLDDHNQQTFQFTAFSNPIKTYVDGVELADSKYISQIDPKSIERIEILTGPQASTIYGSNALNGVMQIFTKRGRAARPQLNLSLISGWVENNFSSGHTPQHDYSAQLNGVEGHLSYNAGGSWNYIGPWTPGKQTTRTGGFGGARFEVPAALGHLSADVTLRRSTTQTLIRGSTWQTFTGYQENGLYIYDGNTSGVSGMGTSILNGQTLGVTLSYAPTSWWSHELGMGFDGSDVEVRSSTRRYATPGDTTLNLSETHQDRRSLRYTTTARIPVASITEATITLGADSWQNLTSFWQAQPKSGLTGTLTGTTNVSRQPGHNTGGFLQTQFGIGDRLFLTYGLRAEWNPGFGVNMQPNYAPRYGLAYTHSFSELTSKLRASYGRSTRPPHVSQKARRSGPTVDFEFWGPHDVQFSNPDLGPEYQQGGEGGIELYFGNRGSLVVTRYNQTVDDLIALTLVDSIDLLPEWQAEFGSGIFLVDQSQYLNVGSIRNQGWELQGSINVGQFTTRGTYSWTKSRVIGVNPKYRAQFANLPTYQPGATFQYLPEHTWALGLTYVKAATSVAINVTGTGQLRNVYDDVFVKHLSSYIRLDQNRYNMRVPLFGASPYINFNKNYALADLVASHRFTPKVEGVLQVQNLADHYTNDYDATFASLGRQMKTGLRITF